MATKITFKDNIVQYSNRYILTDLGGGNYEITASPGTITQAGTPLSAASLNSMADEVIFKLKDTSTSTTTYTADLNGIASYYEGLTILFKPANTNTAASTININGVGAVAIKKTDNSGNIVALTQNDLIKNKYSTMTFDGTQFLMNNPSADLAQVITNIQDLEDRLDTDEASINTLKNQSIRFAVSTGSNNVYGVSLSDVTAYYSGMAINLVPNFNNTGACTLQVNSLTAKAIKFNGSDLASGDLVANKLYTLVYNGVQFELQPDANKIASHLADNTKQFSDLQADYTKQINDLKTSAITSDYTGKITGSNVENPNIMLALSSEQQTLQNPSAFTVEANNSYPNFKYSLIAQQDGICASVSTTTNGGTPQAAFKFNLIDEAERRYGTITGTTADKVTWLKNNIASIILNWYGNGSCPSGNKAYLSVWKASTNAWQTPKSNTNNSPSLISYPSAFATNTIGDLIDVNGFINYLTYTDASDGTTASTINTDYISLRIEFKDGMSCLLTQYIDYVRHPGYAVTSGTSTAYTITLSPAPTSYVDGQQITILPHVDCGAAPTLNANVLGALTILKQDGSAINAGEIKANKPLSLVRVGSNFFMRNYNGKKFATGSGTTQPNFTNTIVTGLTFKPSTVQIKFNNGTFKYLSSDISTSENSLIYGLDNASFNISGFSWEEIDTNLLNTPFTFKAWE